MSIFRQYTYDDSFEQVFISGKVLKQFQIALTFARDYDKNGIPTNGIFAPFWDLTKVTPAAIAQLKKDRPNVAIKVFISIGNRGSQYPFHPTDPISWITNATESLTSIIQNPDYNIQVEGIDVFYEHIDSDPIDFVNCVGEVIKNLKEAKVIRFASISPSAALNKDYYCPLYNEFCNYIDWVDYQFQNELAPISTPTILVESYKKLATSFYPRRKLFAGYSAENEDWAEVSPIVFFLAGLEILKKRRGFLKNRRSPGISILYHNFGSVQP